MLKLANYGIRGKSSSRPCLPTKPFTVNSTIRRRKMYDDKIKEKISAGVLSTDDDASSVQFIQPEEEKNILIPQYMLPKMARVVATKRREFLKMRGSLIAQQEKFIETYAQLREMESRSGVRHDESLGEVRLVAVTGWAAHDLLLLTRDDIDKPVNVKLTGSVGSHVLQQMLSQLEVIPKDLTAVFTELTTCLHNKFLDPKGNANQSASICEAETTRLNKLINDTIENVQNKINSAYELAKLAWVDRDDLLKKLKRTQKENTILQGKLDANEKQDIEKSDEPAESPSVAMDPSNKLYTDELTKERAANKALKNVVATAETLLRVARSRISTLERQIKDMTTELEASKKKYKELEQLYRHRESSYDARSRKLRQESKTGEVTIETLSWQRDGLELRVKELREQAEIERNAAQAREAEMQSRYESLKAQIAEKEKIKSGADVRVVELESKVKDLETELQALREHSAKLVELDRKRCVDYIPKKEKEPSQKETEVWRELQATRGELYRVEEQLRGCRADKDEFLETLAKIAQKGSQGEDSENLQKKIALELVNKEQQIVKLKRQIDDGKKNEQVMEQVMTKYENRLAELRLEVGRLRNHEYYPNDGASEEQENKIIELNMQITALNQERSTILSASACHSLMLERYERSTDLFGHMIRARNELIAILDKKNNDANEDSLSPEATRTLSLVCAKASNTWTALRSERARVMELEAALLAQKIQLERDGHVRTLLEYRRSMLEKMIILKPSMQQNKAAIDIIPVSD